MPLRSKKHESCASQEICHIYKKRFKDKYADNKKYC